MKIFIPLISYRKQVCSISVQIPDIQIKAGLATRYFIIFTKECAILTYTHV